MRVWLTWIVGGPLLLWVLDLAAIEGMSAIGHPFDDSHYWTGWVSWLVSAGWDVGVTASLVAVLIVLPAALIVGLARKWIAADDARTAARRSRV
ncbi:MAG: hypothetical protein QOC77_395 [Thermoleophilaceae bacterium]|jgi:hypothetical protein|nr:hypothetical protein [Thermoleophilaceae bacterium]